MTIVQSRRRIGRMAGRGDHGTIIRRTIDGTNPHSMRGMAKVRPGSTSCRWGSAILGTTKQRMCNLGLPRFLSRSAAK